MRLHPIIFQDKTPIYLVPNTYRLERQKIRTTRSDQMFLVSVTVMGTNFKPTRNTLFNYQ